MAHSSPHRQLSTWLPEKEAKALERLAKQNGRSVSSEIKIAVRAHVLAEKGAAA